MKLVFAAIIAVMVPLAAADKAAQPAPRPEAATARIQEIPAGAVKAEDGWVRYTDNTGKKWLYRKTPFGVVRRPDDGKDLRPDTAAASKAGTADRSTVTVKATEEGDTVHFEKPGPFGMYRWDRKKSELSPDERGWLESARNRGSERTRQE
jgi:hypothetical protein